MSSMHSYTHNHHNLLIIILPLLFILQSLQNVYSLSPLSGTNWKLNLDIGVQPGTWMPKRYPGWGESGARLGLVIEMEFLSEKSTESESLVGPKEDTYVLKVTSPKSTFVSERGEEEVLFAQQGGWCVQRPRSSVRNANGGLVKPQGLLRFWLDCSTGAKRRDVEILPDTRVFFTTGIWDDIDAYENGDLTKRKMNYQRVLSQLESIQDETKEIRQASESQNMFQKLASFRELVNQSKEYDRLKALKMTCEEELPPSGAVVASNGVQMAPGGSLVIKGNDTPDWLPGSEYLILGTFETQSVDL